MSEYIITDEQIAENRRLHGKKLLVMPVIVRCRDCKYRHEGMCMLTDGMGDFKRWFVDDDDYCSDGEKAVGA